MNKLNIGDILIHFSNESLGYIVDTNEKYFKILWIDSEIFKKEHTNYDYSDNFVRIEYEFIPGLKSNGYKLLKC